MQTQHVTPLDRLLDRLSVIAKRYNTAQLVPATDTTQDATQTHDPSGLYLLILDLWDSLPTEVQAVAQPYVTQRDALVITLWMPDSVERQLRPYVAAYVRGVAAQQDGAL